MTTEPDARSLPLATPCGTCDHTRMWHNTDGCTVTACGCGLFTAPPAARDTAGRSLDRRMAYAVLDRLDRGKQPIPGEAAVLRAILTAEQADADQAREQLAKATARGDHWKRAAQEIETDRDLIAVRQAAAERDHNTRRVDLAQTLGQRMDLPWPALLGSVRSVQQANADLRGNADRYRTDRDRWKADAEQARRGEAEAVRARANAEQRAEAMTHAMESTAADALAHGGCHRKLMWQCQRAERAEAEARRNRDAWRNARRRAALMTAEVTRRAPLLGQYAERAEKAEAELARIRGGLYRQIRAAANATVGGDTYDRPARAVRDFARDLETRLPEDTASAVRQGPTCGEPGWAEQERARMERLYTAAYSRAERAEALGRKNFQRASRAEISLRAHQTAITEATERAERAEATLTRVRNMPRLCGDCQINLRAFLDAEQQAPAGALGDPQPATAADDADRIVAHRSQLSGGLFCLRCAPLHSTTPLTADDLPDGGICDRCATDVLAGPNPQDAEMDRRDRLMDDAAHAEREQPAEPQPIVIRLDLVNADRAMRDMVRRWFRDGGACSR